MYSGELGFVLLIAILLVKPIAKYLKYPKMLILRRYLGWAFGSTIFVHLGYWLLYYVNSLEFIIGSITQVWWLFGLLGLITSTILTATSNNWAVKKLGGKLWKKIHVHGIHLLVVSGLVHAHLAIRGYDPTIWIWAVPLMYLLLIRLKIPFLNFMIVVISVIVLSWLISSDNSNVLDVGTEVLWPTTIAEEDIQGWTNGYHGFTDFIPHTWTEEDLILCGGEPVNLDTTEVVYCSNGEVHEKNRT